MKSIDLTLAKYRSQNELLADQLKNLPVCTSKHFADYMSSYGDGVFLEYIKEDLLTTLKNQEDRLAENYKAGQTIRGDYDEKKKDLLKKRMDAENKAREQLLAGIRARLNQLETLSRQNPEVSMERYGLILGKTARKLQFNKDRYGSIYYVARANVNGTTKDFNWKENVRKYVTTLIEKIPNTYYAKEILSLLNKKETLDYNEIRKHLWDTYKKQSSDTQIKKAVSLLESVFIAKPHTIEHGKHKISIISRYGTPDETIENHATSRYKEILKARERAAEIGKKIIDHFAEQLGKDGIKIKFTNDFRQHYLDFSENGVEKKSIKISIVGEKKIGNTFILVLGEVKSKFEKTTAGALSDFSKKADMVRYSHPCEKIYCAMDFSNTALNFARKNNIILYKAVPAEEGFEFEKV